MGLIKISLDVHKRSLDIDFDFVRFATEKTSILSN